MILSGRNVSGSRILLPSSAVTASQDSPSTTPTSFDVARGGTRSVGLHSFYFTHRFGTSFAIPRESEKS